MEDLDKYRAISIHSILGLKHRARVSIRCVFPSHRDNSPSLSIYPNNSFHCFGCSMNGGGGIDFALAVNGCVDLKNATNFEFRKALEDLRDYL